MFDYFKGVIAECTPTQVVIEVNGVGYSLRVPTSTSRILGVNCQHQIFVYTLMREDTLTLYGFATRGERTAFELMQTVSGVGPALALAILSQITPEGFQRAVLTEDVSELKKIKGIGTKTASRLILELKPKLSKISFGEKMPVVADAKSACIAALVALGYIQQTAESAVARAREELPGEASEEDIIRRALQLI